MNTQDYKVKENLSFLLIGDGGTHKTFFIGTCPEPIWVADFDKGMSILAGRDIDYDSFRERPKGEKVPKGGELEREGWYEYGKSWPAFMKKINEIGLSMDKGECRYKTLGVDSLTLCADSCMAFVEEANPLVKDGRQLWQIFLHNMTTLFSQLTGWPLVKVLTAHIHRAENLNSGVVEKLPLIGGKSAGKVPVYFDEVYYTQSLPVTVGTGPSAKKTQAFTVKTAQDGVHRQAKSRALNIPDGSPTDYRELMKIVAARKT